jgi:adenylylsulfate kinase-like enzyme
MTSLRCPRRTDARPGPSASVIIWINGTHGSGKTTTSNFVQKLNPDS